MNSSRWWLFVVIGGLMACAPPVSVLPDAGADSGGIDGGGMDSGPKGRTTIYFPGQYFAERTYRLCYTGSREQATAMLRRGELPIGSTGVTVLEATAAGEQDIRVRYSLAAQVYEALMGPCVFAAEDEAVMRSCEVVVWSRHETVPLTYLTDIETAWRQEDPGLELIHCTRRTAHVIVNGWRQNISLMNYKIVRHLAGSHLPIVPPGASSGDLFRDGSVIPHQHWSAALGFDFMTMWSTIEVLDASVDQLSVPAELDGWFRTNGPRWTPWALEIVRLRCDGLEAIENTRVPTEIPLVNTPSTDAFCARR